MDDRYAQFLIAVGDLCNAATLASLEVEVVTAAGGHAGGVPGAIREAAGEQAVDDSGMARTFRIADRLLNLDEIVECTIHAPAEARL